MEQTAEKSKRYRGANFTKEEELLLLSEIEKYRTVIECKQNDKVNLTLKNEAWKKITMVFNAKTTCHRNVEQMKMKYDNIKCKARKLSATNNIYIRAPEIDPVMESALRIMNNTTFIGLKNHFEFDYPFMKTEEQDEDSKEIILIEGDDETCPVLEQEDPIMVYGYNTDNVNKENSQASTSKTEEYTEQMEITTDCETSTDIQKKDPKSKNCSGRISWCKYTPRKLKLPITKRLRQTLTNSIKNKYYKKKMELIEEEIKRSKLQQEEIIRKKEHDIEEHNKKLCLLELEIQLKQKLLNE